MVRDRTDMLACLGMFLLCLFVFSRGLNIHGLEYRDDEIFYYQSTQEMVQTGDLMSPKYFGQDRFQKPILFYWLVLLAYKICGIGWFGARSVAVVFASMTVVVTWLMGRRLFNRRVATLASVILMTVPLFFRHAKNVVPDMVLNFFIVGAVYFLVRFLQTAFGITGPKGQGREKFSILFFVFCALGFMTKGFIAIIVPFSAVLIFAIFKQNKRIVTDLGWGRGILILLLIVPPWFLYMIKLHGLSYLDYMLVDETRNRLVDSAPQNFAWKFLSTFGDHSVFYLGVIGSYFAPWSLFLIGAVPLAIREVRQNHPWKDGLTIQLIWLFVVFGFFSSIYFSINHYMLVLSVPFALLVSFFFLEQSDQGPIVNSIILVARKYFPAIIFTVCLFAFAFLAVFLADAARGWLFVLMIIYAVFAGVMIRSRDRLVPPMILGITIVLVFAQSPLLDKAGITSHSTLQKFASTVASAIAQAPGSGVAVGVGSHDIHEKEFQAYFDTQVIKAASSDDDDSDEKLRTLFATHKHVFCLIIKKDFERYRKNAIPGTYETVQEEWIFRRRMHIDKGFFRALIRLDRKTINDYLKEKIILVEKT